MLINSMKDGKNTKELNKKQVSFYKKLIKILINIAAVFVTGFIIFNLFRANFTINISPSISTGVYKLKLADEINKGDIVTFEISEDIYNFMLHRGYVNKVTKTFIKKVAGVEGDEIEVDDYLKINRERKKKLPRRDSLGRILPVKEGKYILKENEYFMLGDNQRSFDSSYMGIIKKEQIKNKAELVVEF